MTSSAGRKSGARARGPNTWSTSSDIVTKVRRAWSSGALLRAHAEGVPFEPIEVPLRGPGGAELAEHLDEALRWVAELERASGGGEKYRIVYAAVGGKHLGRTQVPARAVLDNPQQAWRLLGVGGAGGALEQFDEVLRLCTHVHTARAWAHARPLQAIEVANEWPAILAARDWLDWNRGSGRYLREIDAKGVDTKLVERRRAVLAEMLGVSGRPAAFVSELGLAAKPLSVRMRFAPETLGMPAGITEATFRLEELSRLRPQIEEALIIENEISYLSAPVPIKGVLIWGSGFEAVTGASLEWLRPAAVNGRVRYWGDIDTHGFAILHRVRHQLPDIRSVLMDRETLLAHEPRWGSEPSPTHAVLDRLSDAETALYADLVADRYGARLRLEQERIDWNWVLGRLTGPTR